MMTQLLRAFAFSSSCAITRSSAWATTRATQKR